MSRVGFIELPQLFCSSAPVVTNLLPILLEVKAVLHSEAQVVVVLHPEPMLE